MVLLIMQRERIEVLGMCLMGKKRGKQLVSMNGTVTRQGVGG